MFKTKKFFEIRSLERDMEWTGSSFWDAGYKYIYTPTAYAMQYIAKIADKYKEGRLNSNRLDYAVVRSNNEQELIIKITGRTKIVEAFLTDIALTDAEFTKRFSMRSVPAIYV